MRRPARAHQIPLSQRQVQAGEHGHSAGDASDDVAIAATDEGSQFENSPEKQGFRRIQVRYDRLARIQHAWNEIAAAIICFRIAARWGISLR